MRWLLVLIAALCFGCAKPPAEPASAETHEPFPKCPAGEFQGNGLGKSESAALDMARAELAKQVSLSVKVTVESATRQKRAGGQESLSSEYVSRTDMESSLENAHDARVLHKGRDGNKMSATVCMSRQDAAKGFLDRLRQASDSLEIASSAALGEKRPKHKKELWSKTLELWNKAAAAQSLLEGWGIDSAKWQERFAAAKGAYIKTKDSYKEFCNGMKAHWEDSDNECSKAVFSLLSGKTKVEKSECSGGVKFRLSCGEPDCSSTPVGLKCQLEPSLSIEACNGERYLLLKAEPVSGTDMNSFAIAKGRMIDDLRKASFLGGWELEIKEWIPQCVD